MYFEILLAIMSFITSVLFFHYGQKNRKENRNGVGIFYIILGVVWLMLTFYNGYEAYTDYKFQQEMSTPAPAPAPANQQLSNKNQELFNAMKAKHPLLPNATIRAEMARSGSQ
jgi:Na+/melibiose symporter-like transporter